MKTRKELKDEYLQTKSVMGVFQIKNLKTNKVLIVSSTDVHARWNRYKAELKFGSSQNKALQKDWKEFGEDNFEFKILSEIKQKDNTDIDYNKELKLLTEMTLEDLQISDKNRY